MDYYANHYFCTDSNWGGEYEAKHIVSINKFYNYDGGKIEDDWSNIYYKQIFDSEDFNEDFNEASEKRTTTTKVLKPEVVDWLNENVSDRNDEQPKGWGMGTDIYNSKECCSFNIFFHRQYDALKFIKEFSSYKKPLDYFNSFTEKRKKLNLKTLKYEKVK